MNTFRVTIRHFRTAEKHSDCSILVAMNTHNEVEILKAARSVYSKEWWETASITNIEYIGTLKYIEGGEIPRYESDLY